MTEVVLQQRVHIPTLAQRKFLRSILQWDGAATPQEIGPQVSQEENSTRQTCKRRGWVTFDRYYWRITDSGRKALAHSSTDRHGPCQCCGETKDLKCGPSRFGAETWACADCWEPDGKLVPPADRGTGA